MTTLLSNLESGSKQAFQTYTLEHGIERIQIQVPVKQADLFEQEFHRLQNRNKQTVISLLEKVGGKVRG